MKNTFFFILLLLSTLVACTDDEATLGTVDDLVVQGYLYANEPVENFRVTQIVSLASENRRVEPIENAVVTISSEGQTFPLVPTDQAGIYENLDLIPESEKTYNLEVTYQDKVVTASTFIPEAPQSISISETEVSLRKVESFGDLDLTNLPEPIEVNWEDDKANYYFVSVNNVEDNPELVNELFGEVERPEISNEPEITTSFFINSFQFFTHFGRYEVTVFRVNPEYVTLYESTSTGQGALNEVTTNVSGGFGIFTGVSSATIEMLVSRS
ncbi:MAG: DUF4249 family protein [Bacteroidota bacterium]